MALDRRALLRRGALLLGTGPLLAGCVDDPPAAPSADDRLRAGAAERERALLAEYDALLLVLPALAPRLLPLRADHAAHLTALAGPQASPAATTSAAPALPPEVPPTPTVAAALTGLTTTERAAADAHRRAALAAGDGGLAALLASLAASEASHPVALA